MLMTRRAFSAAFLAATLFSQSAHAQFRGVHCPLGCPSSPSGNDVVVYHLFALSNNPDTKFADWVAYEVDIGNFGVSPGRNYSSDPLLSESVTLEKGDYTGANSDEELEADKGHQAPLASFARSVYWYETNYFSNLTPQDEDLNQGPWMHLEVAVREAVEYRNPLYVITGPTYEGEQREMPNADEDHDVPDGYFKVIYNLSGDAASFWMPQAVERISDYCDFEITLSELQNKINFLIPEVHDSMLIFKALGCND